jgi:SOS-response transcriptional repressor LexA
VSPRQRDVYLFIRHWWRLYGYSPTHTEIAQGLGLANGNHVGAIVRRLTEIGVVTYDKGRKRTTRPAGIALKRLIVLDGAAGYV